MNLNGERYVSFDYCESQASFNSEGQWNRGLFSLPKPNLSSIIGCIRRVLGAGFQRIKTLRKLFLPGPTILNPQGPFLQRWNKIFVLSCVIAVSLDPLFLYTPMVDAKNRCLSLDQNLGTIACVLRSFVDLFYVFHIVLQFRTGFVAPFSRVFGRGKLIKNRKAIAKRYLSSYFVVDVLSILPLPQLVILAVIPTLNARITSGLLKIVILAQYVPRFFRALPLYKEATKTSGVFTETAWAGDVFNFILYILASHIFGAFWYLLAIERKDQCWRIACSNNNGCNFHDLYCGIERQRNTSFLDSSCPLLELNEIKNPTDFDFGIFLDAFQSNIDEQRSFFKKFLYCFWWGLRNLSSVGQNLRTSSFDGEILFAIFISIIGLVLFSLLIGNMMQKYFQIVTARVEEMRVKRRDAEQWMSYRMLPESLKERIRRHEQYKWQLTKGVEEDSLIDNLPKDLKRDVKRHLCLNLLLRVPMFMKMNEPVLDAVCSRLKPVLYTEGSYIVREGDPVEEMLFIIRGKLLTMTTIGGQTGFLCSGYLTEGDFCGEELLTWALDPNSSTSLPLSTRKVRAVKDVEAFCLMLDDLKFVTSQFSRLHREQLQHTFRYYSQQWRTWGASLIQIAWRRYYKRKLLKSLQEAEDSPSLGATIYASRFATNMLANLRRNHLHNAMSSPTLSPLLLQKPYEPDFSAKRHS